jgi:UDP-glucose 4-epimerase
MSVLITGAAGYIGSHATLAFVEAGYEVIALDNLTTGFRESIPIEIPFYPINVNNVSAVAEILEQYNVLSVVHFAGSLVVPESIKKPLLYYDNNTCASRSLIQTCVDYGVQNFIFSSTCQTYGIPDKIPVSEHAETKPINPYGRSKLMTEWLIEDTAAAHGLRYVSLRYFNVAGADPQGRSGQSTPNATLLIKVACEAAVGLRDHVIVFGEDYGTPDGTCIRDYVHVSDLVEAHVSALKYLESGGQNEILNCGYGHGYSVREVLEKMQHVANKKIKVCNGPRRIGDPPILIANSDKIRALLNWNPKYDNLTYIVETALSWERSKLK